MTPTEKQQSLDILTRRYGEQKAQVTAIDTRLADYFDGLIAEPQYHNGDELLCAVKLLRLMRTYEVDAEEVQRTLYISSIAYIQCRVPFEQSRQLTFKFHK